MPRKKQQPFDDYEQMELDTRTELNRQIGVLAIEAVSAIQAMIAKCHEAPTPVRNRHEAYGIAAEQLNRISGAVKDIKKATDNLLLTLPDVNYPAIEAVSSICNATSEAAEVMLTAAAEMKRTLGDLYTAESARSEAEGPTPIEKLAEARNKRADLQAEDDKVDEAARKLVEMGVQFQDAPPQDRENRDDPENKED